MPSNMLTFDLVLAMLAFIACRKLILYMNIGWGTGVLFSFIHNFYSVMLNMNIIFKQMFLGCTKCTF